MFYQFCLITCIYCLNVTATACYIYRNAHVHMSKYVDIETYRYTSCWDHYGIVLGSFWNHFEIILESFCDDVAIILQ